MAIDVGFEVSEELASKVYQLIEKVKSEGKLRKGSNEVTKAIERNEAKLVIVANDIEPKEIVMHLPILCKENEIRIITVPTKEELGASAGLPVGTATVAISSIGNAKNLFNSVIKRISELSKPAKKKEPKKEIEKKVEKKESDAKLTKIETETATEMKEKNK